MDPEGAFKLKPTEESMLKVAEPRVDPKSNVNQNVSHFTQFTWSKQTRLKKNAI